MKNRNKGILFFLIIVLVVLVIAMFGSCGKKWKETTLASLKFKTVPSPSTKPLQFISATMQIGEVDFAGTRKKGSDVNFSDKISNGSVIDFVAGSAVPAINYDIPQGTYNSIKLSLKTLENTSSHAFTLNGFFVNRQRNKVDTIPLIFSFNNEETFAANATTESGSNEITLIKDKPVSCEVTLNPNYWFATVTDDLFEKATTLVVNGKSTIVVNESSNNNIYSIVAERIASSTTIVFK